MVLVVVAVHSSKEVWHAPVALSKWAPYLGLMVKGKVSHLKSDAAGTADAITDVTLLMLLVFIKEENWGGRRKIDRGGPIPLDATSTFILCQAKRLEWKALVETFWKDHANLMQVVLKQKLALSSLRKKAANANINQAALEQIVENVEPFQWDNLLLASFDEQNGRKNWETNEKHCKLATAPAAPAKVLSRVSNCEKAAAKKWNQKRNVGRWFDKFSLLESSNRNGPG